MFSFYYFILRSFYLFFSILSELNECPMCEETVNPQNLLDVEDIRPYILASS